MMSTAIMIVLQGVGAFATGFGVCFAVEYVARLYKTFRLMQKDLNGLIDHVNKKNALFNERLTKLEEAAKEAAK